jgi:hypothetical protein
MFFAFINVAYACSIPFLLLTYFVGNKKYQPTIYQLIAVSNHLLIIYSWYLLYKFYQLIQWTLSLNIPLTDNIKNQPIEISWFQIKFILLIVLPYLFLFKKLAANKWLTIILLILLQWDVVVDLFQNLIINHHTAGILFYTPYLLFFKILNYIALFIAVYALLWLLKRLPHQSVK